MPSLIDPALQQEFLREGFVQLRLLDAEQAGSLRQEIMAASASGWDIEHVAGNYLSIYDEHPDRKAQVDKAVRRHLHPSLAEHVRDYQILVNTLFAKPPSGSGTPLHQHAPVSERPFETAITVWCALTDCDADTSALFVVPRSHHLYRFLRVYGEHDFFHDYRATMVERHIRRLSFKAGDALVMDNNLIHGAFENQGSEARLAVAALLIAAESRFMVYHRDGDQIVAMDPADEPGEEVEMMMVGRTDWTGPIRTRFPAWTQAANLAQTEALLARSGPRATEAYDPLTTVAGLASRPPRQAFDWRASARNVPGMLQVVRLGRRMIARWRGPAQ